ncbi:MAG TPA: non-homologous end-joining DNA ligase [Thermoleophilaceae bacterium]|jgi:bifunctional non-homologous end joining protein LigD
MRVEVSRPEKVMFPDDGITKGDLVGWYERAAEWMLPHIRGRPVSMQRFPDGIGRHGFFHKDVPDHFPDWIERVEVPKSGGTVTHAVVTSADALVYLANQACITPHVWLSREDRLDRPDRMVFDLDPPGSDFGAVRRAARALGDLLDELELPRFAMVTGSRGIHVWVPLRRNAVFDDVRDFARDVGRLMTDRHPGDLTMEHRKAKRGGRIFVDVGRNAYAQTAVPPYAVRPRRGAPVAMPIEWRELSDSRLRPDRWTLTSAPRRLAAKGDAWAEIASHARGLSKARKLLDRLFAE